ncbi:PolC-type DNA polymerase III [Deferribacter thermophilus]|uniref:3'-5' exonuclease n=1 Tax=Deferribacter thermophilus TaxID=53573 RepID=UPI003C2F85C8
MNKDITSYKFTVVDTETTGLTPYKGAKLVEIGAVRIDEGLKINLERGFSTLINPEKPIPYSAYKIHKINDDMVRHAPTIEKVLPHFSNYVENTVFVAHNAPFDFKFIDYFYKACRLSCPLIAVLDTIKIAKRVIPGLKSYSLDSLINYFNLKIELPGTYRHRAIFDAIHTAFIFKKLVTIEKNKKGLLTLGDLVTYCY